MQEHARFSMLTKIRERSQGALLREELLCGEANSRTLAEAIAGGIAADSLQPSISASIGVAVYPQDGETMEALLRTADCGLYRMKRFEEEPIRQLVAS
jgi:predicted signal transduction protein with EAL and GGDEF domain